jgi:hypothetical protein
MFALILLIVALVLFVLAAVNVPSTRVNLLAAGLAFYIGSLLVGRF